MDWWIRHHWWRIILGIRWLINVRRWLGMVRLRNDGVIINFRLTNLNVK